MRRPIAAVTGLLCLGLTACGGASPAAVQTVTVIQPAPTSSSAQTPSNTEMTPAPSDVDTPTEPLETDATTSGPPALEPGVIGLDSFFEPSADWTENRFDVADRGQVKGVSAEITQCGQAFETLEMRLSNKFKALKFTAGQDNSSESSDDLLIISVNTNGKQADVRKIKFNTVQEFNISVDGVNAVQLSFTRSRPDGQCFSKDIRAVLFDGTLS